MPHGKLNVVVEGAADIKPPLGTYGRGGSYCTLACGNQVFTSPTVEGGSFPRFKTAFEFDINSTTNALNVCVYSKGSTPRDDDLVGYCTLNFKQVFYGGHIVPLTAFPIQQPTGQSGGKINISLKFKMRPKPNGHNAHVPMRHSPGEQVTHKVVGRQTVSLDWGFEENCRAQPVAQTSYHRQTSQSNHEGYLKMPGTASSKIQEVQQPHKEYPNLPGSASDNYQVEKPNFVRYNVPPRHHPSSPPPQASNHARPSPMTVHNQPVPAKPHYNPPIPLEPHYSLPIPPKPHYNPPIPLKHHYNPPIPPEPHYNPPIPAKPHHNQLIFTIPQKNQQVVEVMQNIGGELVQEMAGEAVNQMAGEMMNQLGINIGQGLLDGFCNF